jgi:hypothetical protein
MNRFPCRFEFPSAVLALNTALSAHWLINWQSWAFDVFILCGLKWGGRGGGGKSRGSPPSHLFHCSMQICSCNDATHNRCISATLHLTVHYSTWGDITGTVSVFFQSHASTEYLQNLFLPHDFFWMQITYTQWWAHIRLFVTLLPLPLHH